MQQTLSLLAALGALGGLASAAPALNGQQQPAATWTSAQAAAATPALSTQQSGGDLGSGKTADGAQGATVQTSKNAGPNGAESWFNTGVDASGWKPPTLAMASVVHTSTSSFYAGVGQQCKQYDRYFAESAARHSLDPMLLAAVAMQESSCNAEAASSTGIPGLMQVACVNFPGGRCSDDVSDGVEAAAKFLAEKLGESGNNIVHALGAYNGWSEVGGSSKQAPITCGATAGVNLDYIQQVLNGWMQGVDGSTIGQYGGSSHC